MRKRAANPLLRRALSLTIGPLTLVEVDYGWTSLKYSRSCYGGRYAAVTWGWWWIEWDKVRWRGLLRSWRRDKKWSG